MDRKYVERGGGGGSSYKNSAGLSSRKNINTWQRTDFPFRLYLHTKTYNKYTSSSQTIKMLEAKI
jgi:hypothetical protein